MKRLIGGILLVGVTGVYVGATRFFIGAYGKLTMKLFRVDIPAAVTVVLLAGSVLLMYFGIKAMRSAK